MTGQPHDRARRDARVGPDAFPLVAFAAAPAGPWRWTRRGRFSRDLDLRAGERALVSYRAHGFGGREAVATTLGQVWRVHTRGWVGRTVEVQAEGATSPAVRARLGWFGHAQVTLADGRELTWQPTGFWGRRWELRGSGGVAVVSLDCGPSSMWRGVGVSIAPGSAADPATAALVVLSFDLMRRMQQATLAMAH